MEREEKELLLLGRKFFKHIAKKYSAFGLESMRNCISDNFSRIVELNVALTLRIFCYILTTTTTMTILSSLGSSPESILYSLS